MQIVPKRERIIDRILEENERAMAADMKAVQDYNIMMGILADPNEGEIEND